MNHIGVASKCKVESQLLLSRNSRLARTYGWMSLHLVAGWIRAAESTERIFAGNDDCLHVHFSLHRVPFVWQPPAELCCCGLHCWHRFHHARPGAILHFFWRRNSSWEAGITESICTSHGGQSKASYCQATASFSNVCNSRNSVAAMITANLCLASPPPPNPS